MSTPTETQWRFSVDPEDYEEDGEAMLHIGLTNLTTREEFHISISAGLSTPIDEIVTAVRVAAMIVERTDVDLVEPCDGEISESRVH
jgi:hypothetical protein